MEQLTPEPKSKLAREIADTRQLEKLLLHAKRLPDLVDLAGSLDLYVPDELMEEGTVLLARHPAPTAGSPASRA